MTIKLPPNAEPEAAIKTAQHDLVLLPEVALMLCAIFRDIERAKRRVYIECYIVVDDQLGRALGDALVRSVAKGIETRLIYDPLGSEQANPAFFDELRAKGVFVRAYRPGDIVLGKGSMAPRDHSRVMVIDEAAYTGGAAWSDPWLPKESGGEGWHDVSVRVEGPIVEDFARAFGQRWIEADGSCSTPVDIDTEDAYPDLRLVADTSLRDSLVYLRHREAVQRAKRRVWLENAYFFPPVPLLRDLYEAAARGVDVQIMLPKVSDLRLVKRAACSEYVAWLEHGLVLWEYTPCVLHSKVAVVDDDWCTIGTFNANSSSLGLANEVNLFVVDQAFVARVARLFETDREKCQAVTMEKARARSFPDQALDALASGVMSFADALLGPTSE